MMRSRGSRLKIVCSGKKKENKAKYKIESKKENEG